MVIKKYLTSKTVEASGWICGLVTAAVSNYFILPLLTNKVEKMPLLLSRVGKMPVTITVGLALGLVIMLIFIKLTQYLISFLYRRYNFFAGEKIAEVDRLSKKERKQLQLRIRFISRIIGVSVLLGVIGFFGTFAILKTVIQPLQKVASIKMKDGSIQKINVKEFRKRLLFERSRYRNINNNKSENKYFEYTLGFAAIILEKMTNEVLIREEAERRNLEVKKEEIDVYGPTTAYFRSITHVEILGNKLKEAFSHDIPFEEERVCFKLIRFESESDASKAVTQYLNNGNYSILYEKATKGLVRNATGMIRDWSSASELTRDFNLNFSDIVFNMRVGDNYSKPVEAVKGWYLIQVLGHEQRKMTEEWRKQRGEDAFRNWLEVHRTRITEFPVWMKRVPKLKKDIVDPGYNPLDKKEKPEWYF